MTRRTLLIACSALLAWCAIPGLASGVRTHSTSVAPCAPQVKSGQLPVWMRAGFAPGARVTHVLGERGAIGAVLWDKPLYSPPAQTVNNKILWVPRHPSRSIAAMWIKMQKMDGTQLVGAPVRRVIANGPGPSYVDAPSAGCWRLTLSWSGQKDTLDLSYVPPTD
jgi:hypothetical protein